MDEKTAQEFFIKAVADAARKPTLSATQLGDASYWRDRAEKAEKRIAELEEMTRKLDAEKSSAELAKKTTIEQHKVTLQRIAELEAELAKTKEGLSIAVEAMVKRWIPCSERLPEESSEVLGVTFFGNMRIYDYFGKSWFSSGRNLDKPTHWMPLPEPPEVE